MPLPSWLRAAGRGLKFVWDATAGRFFGTAGKADAPPREVPPAAVREALDSAIDVSRDQLRLAGEGLVAGDIPLDEWQQTLADEVKAVHTMAVLVAVGGEENLSPAARATLTDTLTYHLGKLGDFAAEVASGSQALDGTLPQRAGLYAESAIGTYEDYRRADEVGRGATWERRVLDAAAESCAGCLDAAGEGWQPVGTLPRIGETECGPRCRCSFEYSDSEGEPDEGEAPFASAGFGSPDQARDERGRWSAGGSAGKATGGKPKSATVAMPAPSLHVRPVLGASGTPVSQDQLAYVQRQVDKVPLQALQITAKAGSVIEIVGGRGVTDHPSNAHFRGVTPRGWEGTGKTWDDVPGAGAPYTGFPTIIAARGAFDPTAHGSANLILHEHAHTIDACMKGGGQAPSGREDWQAIHTAERWPDAYQQHYPAESWAESFARMYHGESTRAALPAAVRDYFTGLFGETPAANPSVKPAHFAEQPDPVDPAARPVLVPVFDDAGNLVGDIPVGPGEMAPPLGYERREEAGG